MAGKRVNSGKQPPLDEHPANHPQSQTIPANPARKRCFSTEGEQPSQATRVLAVWLEFYTPTRCGVVSHSTLRASAAGQE